MRPGRVCLFQHSWGPCFLLVCCCGYKVWRLTGNFYRSFINRNSAQFWHFAYIFLTYGIQSAERSRLRTIKDASRYLLIQELGEPSRRPRRAAERWNSSIITIVVARMRQEKTLEFSHHFHSAARTLFLFWNPYGTNGALVKYGWSTVYSYDRSSTHMFPPDGPMCGQCTAGRYGIMF